ncbi:MAG: 16S rRNA (uracil(1498)-N(3))-methyltransferase [Desulfuromonas sp.]|nr:MAG: 16S rRNA (uracil(1498)-N(3))-methyltransferase [Desulfuromonas sp.]
MADPPRFFVTPEALRQDPAVISGEPFHHLQRVLRLPLGSPLLLLDGTGNRAYAKLAQIKKSLALASVVRRDTARETALPIVLMQSLPKGDKFDLTLQKGTELGITVFQPLTSRYSIPELPPQRLATRLARWQKIVQEACRQSRRDLLPEVKPPISLQTAIGQTEQQGLKLMLWEAASQPLAEVLPKAPPRQVVLLAGPEGGFSAEEVDLARIAGFLPVHLGPRILRTETAGLAVTPVLQYLYGDWSCNPPESVSPD